MQASKSKKKLPDPLARDKRQLDLFKPPPQTPETLDRVPTTGAPIAAGDRLGPVPQRKAVAAFGRCDCATARAGGPK